MKIFILALVAFLAIIFQLTLAQKLAIFDMTPNLILAGVISLAITAKDPIFKWLVLGWILFFDLLAGRPFGILTLSFFIIFFLINWLVNYWLKQSGFWAILFLGILGIVFFDLAVFLFQKAAAVFFAVVVKPPEFFRFLFDLIPDTLFNLPVFLAVFYLLGKFKKFLAVARIT